MIYSFSDVWLVPHHCSCYVFYFIFGYRDEIFLGLAVDCDFCRLIAPGQRATPQLLATLYLWAVTFEEVSAECLPVAAIECSTGCSWNATALTVGYTNQLSIDFFSRRRIYI